MSKTPRRMQMLQWCKAEKMIQEAVDEVEGMGADIRLTAAVIALSEARDHVADFVDGAPFRPTSTRVSDSQGEVDLKSPLTAREEELQKLYLASQDNRREERLLHDRALSTLRERMNRITEETETARIQLTKENLMTIILRIARLSRAEKEEQG